MQIPSLFSASYESHLGGNSHCELLCFEICSIELDHTVCAVDSLISEQQSSHSALWCLLECVTTLPQDIIYGLRVADPERIPLQVKWYALCSTSEKSNVCLRTYPKCVPYTSDAPKSVPPFVIHSANFLPA